MLDMFLPNDQVLRLGTFKTLHDFSVTLGLGIHVSDFDTVAVAD